MGWGPNPGGHLSLGLSTPHPLPLPGQRPGRGTRPQCCPSCVTVNADRPAATEGEETRVTPPHLSCPRDLAAASPPASLLHHQWDFTRPSSCLLSSWEHVRQKGLLCPPWFCFWPWSSAPAQVDSFNPFFRFQTSLLSPQRPLGEVRPAGTGDPAAAGRHAAGRRTCPSPPRVPREGSPTGVPVGRAGDARPAAQTERVGADTA